ncbi:MAG: redoxin domain-containing protein [Bacteroidota bacterium]
MHLKIKMLLITIFILGGSFFGYQFYKSVSRKQNSQQQIATLLDFKFETLKGKSFSKKDLSKNKKKLFIHFNSDCDICQNEALKFSEKIQDLKEYQILYISYESPKNIDSFSRKFGLDQISNITFLRDVNTVFYSWVESHQVPYILAYDENDKLVYQHKGMTIFSKLIESLENGH